jgi:hypothetical protein
VILAHEATSLSHAQRREQQICQVPSGSDWMPQGPGTRMVGQSRMNNPSRNPTNIAEHPEFSGNTEEDGLLARRVSLRRRQLAAEHGEMACGLH